MDETAMPLQPFVVGVFRPSASAATRETNNPSDVTDTTGVDPHAPFGGVS